MAEKSIELTVGEQTPSLFAAEPGRQLRLTKPWATKIMIDDKSLANFTRLVLVMLAAAVLTRSAAAQSYERFFGDYEGEAISDTGGELEKRDLEVSIGPIDDGFSINWVVVTTKTSGKIKRKEYTVNFKPSGRENIYRSAMRTDMFGQAVPLDPLKGDPYVWARIEDDALRVHALIIREDGGYELQVYNRVLTPSGMDLSYSRIRDGEILRTVTGTLKRR